MIENPNNTSTGIGAVNLGLLSNSFDELAASFEFKHQRTCKSSTRLVNNKSTINPMMNFGPTSNVIPTASSLSRRNMGAGMGKNPGFSSYYSQH